MKTTTCRPTRRQLTGIVAGILAGLALSYAEYRAIDQAQTFPGVDLIVRSLDLRRVLDPSATAKTDRRSSGAMANATIASRSAQRDRRQSGRL